MACKLDGSMTQERGHDAPNSTMGVSGDLLNSPTLTRRCKVCPINRVHPLETTRISASLRMLSP